jgi:hypothetical protein
LDQHLRHPAKNVKEIPTIYTSLRDIQPFLTEGRFFPASPCSPLLAPARSAEAKGTVKDIATIVK